MSGSTWTPSGDDATRGWLWTYQKYDWKGRVVRKINTDGADSSTLNDSDVLISYEGCGCAGGQVTTIQGPSVPRDDQPNQTARRKQRSYEDILGRKWKSEAFNWGGSVYSTSTVRFNGRDQVLDATQTEAATSVSQVSTMSYDGHGRMISKHLPSEFEGSTLKYSNFTYNVDDSVATVTDPRGAVVSYSYGHPGADEVRPLLTGISYAPPSTQPTYTTISDTPDVSFSYDDAANRTAMTDGSGSTSYVYDSLSRITSETKTFSGLSGNFTVNYAYQLSGKLKSLTDPFGAVVDYNNDKLGRTAAITGSGFASVTNYASAITYRAFGGVKGMTYDSSDASQISYGYDNGLRISTYEATSSVLSGGYIRKASYEYFNDSRTKKATNVLDSGFNQEYGYDSIGRISASASGTKVNSQNQNVMPFAQSLGYNAFGDLTERNTDVWGAGGGFAATYTNGHKDNSGEIYDAAGNVVDATTSSTIYKRWKFDASGRSVETAYRWYQSVPSPQIDRTETIVKTYDGDGLDTKRVDTKDFILYPGGTQSTSSTEYYVRSTVLGGKLLTELDQAGAKKLTNVYAGDGVLAEQRIIGGAPGVFWRHEDSITGSYRKIGQNGEEGGSLADSPANVEYDPLGGAIPTIDPLTDPLLSQPSSMRQFKSAGDVNRPEYGCVIDGEMRKDVGACSRALKHGIGRLSENFDQSRDALAEIGIVAFWNGVSGRSPIDPKPSVAYGDGGKWEIMFREPPFQKEIKNVDRDFIDSVRPFLKLALERDSCKQFVQKYVGAVDLLDAFDKLLEQGGLIVVPARPGEPQAAFAIGLIQNKTARIEFNHDPNPYPAKVQISAYIGTKNMVSTLIHELIHLIDGRNHDSAMATRIADGGDNKNPLPQKDDYDKFGKRKDGTAGNYVFDVSNFWNTPLRSACNPSDEVFRRWWHLGGDE